MNGIPSVHAPGLTGGDYPGSKPRKAAQDFESVLLGSLLEQMEQVAQDESSDSETGNMISLGTEQIARVWAQRGGVGIAKVIMPFLEKQATSLTSTQLKLPARLPMIVEGDLNAATAK